MVLEKICDKHQIQKVAKNLNMYSVYIFIQIKIKLYIALKDFHSNQYT